MPVWNQNVGSNRMWAYLLSAVLLLGVTWPGIQVTYWHFTNETVLHQGAISLTLPLLWTSSVSEKTGGCLGCLSITKHAPTIFGSADAGSALSVIGGNPLYQGARDIFPLENVFRSSNSDVAPFTLTKKITRCWKGRDIYRSPAFTNLLCELPDGSVFIFSGTNEALTEMTPLTDLH